jgi:hypothetical protein
MILLVKGRVRALNGLIRGKLPHTYLRSMPEGYDCFNHQVIKHEEVLPCAAAMTGKGNWKM